jgi:hypothetical protein
MKKIICNYYNHVCVIIGCIYCFVLLVRVTM